MKKRWWIAIGCVGFVLVYFGRLIEWGYHEENGLVMAGDLSSGRISNVEPSEGRAFASEVCGEPVEFDRIGNSSYWSMMPELVVARHFTLYGLYRNTIWVALGAKGKFCLARYEIAMRRHDCAWPFPYCNRWSWTSLDEVRLLNRIQSRPQVPPGTKALLPGECASGELAPGEAAMFQVEIPRFGQHLKIIAAGDNRSGGRLDVQIGKTGRAMESYTERDYNEEPGGGTYQIRLKAPATDRKFYIVRAYWGHDGAFCREPQGWREPPPRLPDLEEAPP